MKVFLDTNVVLAFLLPAEPQHEIVRRALDHLTDKANLPVVSPQIIFESWASLTRPRSANGFELAPPVASELLERFTKSVLMVPMNAAVHAVWQQIVRMHDVKGRKLMMRLSLQL